VKECETDASFCSFAPSFHALPVAVHASLRSFMLQITRQPLPSFLFCLPLQFYQKRILGFLIIFVALWWASYILRAPSLAINLVEAVTLRRDWRVFIRIRTRQGVLALRWGHAAAGVQAAFAA
jgi:hypothetical protein